MAKQTINLGTSANKGDGDPLRTAFDKVNDNFDELYLALGNPSGATNNVLPNLDATIDLGSADKQWSDLYVKDFIYLNGARITVTSGGALLVNGGAPAEVQDTVGSVFGDDSTLLVDGVNSQIVGDYYGTLRNQNWMAAYDGFLTIANGGSTGPGPIQIVASANLDLSAGAGQVINANRNIVAAEGVTGNVSGNVTGDVKGSVFADDSSVMVDAINQTMFAETLTTLAVFGNPTLALNADSIVADARNGNLTLQTTDTITNNFVNGWEVQGTNGASIVLNDDGVVSSELSVNVAVVDFGTGNTVDLQGNSVLFDGAIIQNFAPGSIYAKNGQYLYIASASDGGTTTNVAFIYDTIISNVKQTFYGKTEFGNNGQAPVVDFTGATFSGEPWISLADLKTEVAASTDFEDFQARIAAL